MSPSGAVSIVQSLSSLDTAQAALSAQVSVQRGVLDLHQDIILRLLASAFADVGVGANLNLLA